MEEGGGRKRVGDGGAAGGLRRKRLTVVVCVQVFIQGMAILTCACLRMYGWWCALID